MLAEGIIPARLDPKAPKRGKGQPPGSKNKKTLEREAALAREEKLTTETAPVQFELADASWRMQATMSRRSVDVVGQEGAKTNQSCRQEWSHHQSVVEVDPRAPRTSRRLL